MIKTIFPKKYLVQIVCVCLLGLVSKLWALDEGGANTDSDKEWADKKEVVYVAIIIDDLGYKQKQDRRATQLPGEVTYAFLPHTPYVNEMAEIVHAQGHEVMLHLPMQSTEPLLLGPGGLTNEMTEQEFKTSIVQSIRSIPHVKGVNNHMGSLMSSQTSSMNWLMDELIKTDLFFVDSRTTVKTVAEQTASHYNINNTRRNVFLDHEHNRQAIELQFERLITLAKSNGSAVAIGHPFDITLDVLEEKIPLLEAAGIKLIKVSNLIQQQTQRKSSIWQASLSPSQQAVKSLKPLP